MALDSFDRPTLLLFADRLEAEGRLLPRWDAGTSERWDVFADRRYEAELALALKLQALRSCQLSMCSTRADVKLTLLGVRVATKKGLADACLRWAERARVQSGDLTRTPPD